MREGGETDGNRKGARLFEPRMAEGAIRDRVLGMHGDRAQAKKEEGGVRDDIRTRASSSGQKDQEEAEEGDSSKMGAEAAGPRQTREWRRKEGRGVSDGTPEEAERGGR